MCSVSIIIAVAVVTRFGVLYLVHFTKAFACPKRRFRLTAPHLEKDNAEQLVELTCMSTQEFLGATEYNFLSLLTSWAPRELKVYMACNRLERGGNGR